MDIERVSTTFWQDFSIAEKYSYSAVKDTFNRAFNDWKGNYKYLTELAMTLNHKCWYWYEEKNTIFQEIYQEYFYTVQDYAYENLKGEELKFYFAVTD